MYNVNIRWRINDHWGISAVSANSPEGYVEIAILSFRNWSAGEWTDYNHHGFLDNNFSISRHFPLDLIPVLVGWLRYKLSVDYDYCQIVNVEYGRHIFEEFLDFQEDT